MRNKNEADEWLVRDVQICVDFLRLGEFTVIMFLEHRKGVGRQALSSFEFLVTIHTGRHMNRLGEEDMAHIQKGVLIPVLHGGAARVEHRGLQCIITTEFMFCKCLSRKYKMKGNLSVSLNAMLQLINHAIFFSHILAYFAWYTWKEPNSQ
jgi:hypothetical protein